MLNCAPKKSPMSTIKPVIVAEDEQNCRKTSRGAHPGAIYDCDEHPY